MSFQAMTWAIEQKPSDAESKLILLLLANYAGDESTCWPSVRRLSLESMLCERTVQTKLRGLEQAGLIAIKERWSEHGDNSTNLYKLHHLQQQMHHPTASGALPRGASHAPKPVSTEPVIEPNTGKVVFSELTKTLADAFYRPQDSPWSYAEESTLAELIRERPKLDRELSMILDWRLKMDPKKRKFFPTSVYSLLCNWSQTVDRARLFFREPEPVEPGKL